MKVANNAAMYQAVKTLMQKVPGLVADSRPQSMQEVAARLAAQGVEGASLIAKADAATVAQVRKQVIKDVYSSGAAPSTAALTGDAQAPKGAKPTAIVSGGSYTGMLTAIALAKSGKEVTLVEPRPNHTRSIRLGSRQGMIDTLAVIDPALAKEFLKRATKLDPEGYRHLDLSHGKPERTSTKTPGRAPDASKAPETGAEMMTGSSSAIVIASEFESLIEQYVKKNFPTQIKFEEGKLHPVVQDDGNVKWQVERAVPKGAPPQYEDLLGGKKPGMVLVAEGSGSTTRTALGIATAESTPQQYWTAGVIHTTDQDTQKPGLGTMKSVYTEEQAKNPATGKVETVSVSATAISDGKQGTWVLTQMPPFFAPDAARPQQEINDHYFKQAALVTGQSEAELRKAGAEGPIAMPNSVPVAFPLQGRVSQEAARVMPDGTVVGFMGDSVETNTFQAGGGMNTAIGEVLCVMTLVEDLQSGVSPQEAAAKYQTAVFERADSWGAAGIPYFYREASPEQTQQLVADHLKAIADWRKEGGPSPLARLQKMLEEQGFAAGEPVGQKLAA